MWSFGSVTGGAGCTTVAVAASVVSARRRPTLLVDLHGNGETALAQERSAVGLVQWLEAARPPPDALSRLERPVGPSLSVLPFGDPPASVPAPDRVSLVTRLLAADERQVVIDFGTTRGWCDPLLAAGERSIAVTRACYLAVAAAGRAERAWDGVVLVREPERLLRRPEIGSAFGAPVVASVRWDPAVAAAIDVGTMAVRLPRSLRPLARVVDSW